jgi:hypothetical protein
MHDYSVTRLACWRPKQSPGNFYLFPSVPFNWKLASEVIVSATVLDIPAHTISLWFLLPFAADEASFER